MLNIEVRFKLEGRGVSVEAVAQNALDQITNSVKSELVQLPSQIRPVADNCPSQHPVREPLSVSVPETARLLGLKPATIRAWVSARKIRAVRIGRRVMIPMETVRQVSSDGLPTRR